MNMLNKKITWRKQHKWLGIGMSFFHTDVLLVGYFAQPPFAYQRCGREQEISAKSL